jgi:hypothetical protein
MLLIMVHQAAAQNGGFAPAVSFDVGPGPAYATGVDANGDGKTELLISANTGDSTLTVLTNNGSGGFGSNDTLNVGSSPLCVVVADVNGNGRPALISANFGDGTLTVLTNNGSGGFGSNDTLVVGAFPTYVAAADVNGDGKIDLICANYGDNGSGSTLTVLTNNGRGRFVLATTPSVGNGPYAVVAVDVNGDGKMDLISADAVDSTLTVLTNNGSGRFGFYATLPVGTFPQSVAAADVNGDGKKDLISANTTGGTLTVLTNNDSGQFGLNATLNVGLSTNSAPASVVAADVNGDGKMDLISANFGDNTLTVLTNNGSGRFGLSSTLDAGQGPNSVTAVDVNGDGLPDLVIADYIDDAILLLLNTNTPPPPTLAISLTGPQTVVVSWPKSAAGFVLQQNSNLTTMNWLGFSGTINTNTTTKSATISPATNNLFFRLRHP